ncbi:MAG TPA: LPXTG cell wall anchor domain-containing protein [Marmoricola sp.]|nr:LPXTG cell wall anchor domain-containing protein [Marmoricola sp.]
MNKHKRIARPAGTFRVRSLLSFRHQNPIARLVSGAAAFATATVLAVGMGPAYAVHDTGMFELDGNIAHTGAATYDWGNLFTSAGARAVTPDPENGPLLASDFNADATDPDPSYFTSNKDIQGIGDWGCTTLNNPTPKDDLQNAYAALVQVPADAPDNAGHKVLYLGSERQSNNGDSFAGFWLLKNNNVGCHGPGGFSGTHTDGDILVLSNYTNGGGTQDVQVYKWSGNDATGSPVPIPGLSGSTCGGASTDTACAIANTQTITSAWSPTSHASNTFVEAGIDLNVLLDATGGGCFTTFLAETRSSQEITATLKDFAAGQFNTCPPAPLQTTATPGGSTVAPGTAQHDVATVSAVGGRPVPTGTVTFFLCQPSQVTSAGCPSGAGAQVGSPVTISSGSATSANTTNDTTTGTYCWRAEYTPDSAAGAYYVASSHTNNGSECFTVVHASPTITTQIAVTGANSPGLGFTTLGDTATLHDFVPGTVTGDTVDFNLYDVTADPGCTGSVVFHTTGTLNASGVATTSTTFSPTAAHTYTWIASYPGDSFNDAASGQCSDAHESATIVGAQVDVSKSANPPGPVSAGSPIGFDITVSNSGSVPAQGVQVTDTLPAGADGVAGGNLDWSLDPSYTGCAITGAVGSQVLSCDLGTVNGSTSLPVIHLTSPTAPADCGVVKNKATVSTTNGTGGDSDVASVTVLCPGLHITKTADAASVNVGEDIGFTVTVSNNGQGTASGVNLSDPLPTGPGITWTIDSSTGPLSCSITSGTLSCTGSLDAGATQVVHVTSPTEWTGTGETEVNSCLGGTDGSGVYDNTAQVSATNVSGTPDASAHEQVLCPALDIAKAADAETVDAGSPIGFTITAANTGDGTAVSPFISDPLPGGVVWTIESQTGPLTCDISEGTLACSGEALAAGQSQVVHITAPTTYEECGVFDNTATLTSTNAPGGLATASTAVQCPNLALAKTADAASVDAGGQIGFTVTATNRAGEGVGTAHGVVIDDPLPSGTGIDWSIASGPENCSIQGTPPSETLHCTAVDLAPGASETVHVVSGTGNTSCQAYPNTATLTAGNAPGSITANATTTVTNCVLVSPPIVSPPKQHHPAVLPNTGGPQSGLLAAGVLLLLGGGGLVVGGRRRRRRS